ncbi:MAG: hypothetical protein WBE26_17990 [Phycisphaerae bacterium]
MNRQMDYMGLGETISRALDALPDSPKALPRDECACCHRRGVLKRIWLVNEFGWECEKCGYAVSHAEMQEHAHRARAGLIGIMRTSPLVKSVLEECALLLLRASRGDSDAIEAAGNTVRQAIRLLEHWKVSEWFGEAD